MRAEWQVECAADDVAVVLPWSDASGLVQFIDLRAHPDAIDELAEAEAHPPLMQALRALNARRSPVFTAKCDAWEMTGEEVEQLRIDLGMDMEGEAEGIDAAGDETNAQQAGFASYIDVICRERTLFASFARQEHLLRRVTRAAGRLKHQHAALECVLRPAVVSLKSAREGYATSVYVKALGESSREAWSEWAAALGDVVEMLRRGGIFR